MALTAAQRRRRQAARAASALTGDGAGAPTPFSLAPAIVEPGSPAAGGALVSPAPGTSSGPAPAPAGGRSPLVRWIITLGALAVAWFVFHLAWWAILLAALGAYFGARLLGF